MDNDRVTLTSENTEPCMTFSVGEVSWVDETGGTRFLALEINGRYILLIESQAYDIVEALEIGLAR